MCTLLDGSSLRPEVGDQLRKGRFVIASVQVFARFGYMCLF